MNACLFYIYTTSPFFNSRDNWACIYQALSVGAKNCTSGYRAQETIGIPLFLLWDTWWTPALEVRETVCFICALDVWRGPGDAVCYRFICAEKGTGGLRAPWPLERAVTSPAIMWLHPTPSRQKSKPPFFFFLPLSHVFCLLTKRMKEFTSNVGFLNNFPIYLSQCEFEYSTQTLICFLVIFKREYRYNSPKYEATESSELA